MKSLTRDNNRINVLTGAAFLCALLFLAVALLTDGGGGIPTRAQSAEETPDPAVISNDAGLHLAPSGRLQFFVIADSFPVDESGKVILGKPGHGVSQTCEADALVILNKGVVTDVRGQGIANSVSQGDRVVAAPAESGPLEKVYWDPKGELRVGCDPDSWVIVDID
ncbi:MAG: hypothetical protein WD904_07170 [Dehalococcoidia bacterium]